MDAGNLLKPALASGKLRCIGSTTFSDVKQSFDKAYVPKNGTVTVADFDFKAQSQLTFQNALITSVGFPALKGESKDAKGQQRLVRDTDGVHFTDYGYDMIADRVWPPRKR